MLYVLSFSFKSQFRICSWQIHYKVRDELTLISSIVLHKANFITIATYKTYNIYPNWKDGINLHQALEGVKVKVGLMFFLSHTIIVTISNIKRFLRYLFFINTVWCDWWNYIFCVLTTFISRKNVCIVYLTSMRDLHCKLCKLAQKRIPISYTITYNILKIFRYIILYTWIQI